MNESINGKNKRAERPDRALFNAMTGVFFLLFAVAPAYWAFYNYGQIQRTEELLRHWSQQPESMPTDSYGGNPFAIQKSRADRYKLEMSLSGAGALVLFGISLLLLFRGAMLKVRTGKQTAPQFEPIDWRTIPTPTARVEVQYKSLYNVLFVFLIIFFGGLALLNFTQTMFSRSSSTNDIVVRGILFNGFCLLILFVLGVLMIRARRKSARCFDASGITRGDGRHFPWSEFRGVITQININQRTRIRYVWRIELACADGETAWIIPNRVKNIDEVMNFIHTLPGTHQKIRA